MTRVLFALQALISFASAVALVASPRLIPASVGVPVAPSAFLLCYLIGASELTLALVSTIGFRTRTDSTADVVVFYSIAFHLSSGLAGAYAVASGLPKAIWTNAGAHFVLALLFLFALYRNIMRRSLQAMHCQ